MLFAPQQLHIPDGFLSTSIALAGWALGAIILALALRSAGGQFGDRQVPWMGVLAAFIFAAQAINFPIAAGTSGHLQGGTLAAILAGPWSATLIMTAVIAIQALLFQDGGLLAMGWNLINMGALAALSGWAVYRLLGGRSDGAFPTRALPAFIAGWVSVVVAAGATAVELALSGSVPIGLAFPAMVGTHAIIGIGEGLITAAALLFLASVRPSLLPVRVAAPGSRSAVYVLLILVLGLGALAPWASKAPDGLEAFAKASGFLDRAIAPLYTLMPNYALPFVQDRNLTTILAVVLGSLIVFLVTFLIVRSRTRPELTPAEASEISPIANPPGEADE